MLMLQLMLFTPDQFEQCQSMHESIFTTWMVYGLPCQLANTLEALPQTPTMAV